MSVIESGQFWFDRRPRATHRLGFGRSIDSDLDNVVAILRMFRILPAGLDIKPLIQEAKRQLHMEAFAPLTGAVGELRAGGRLEVFEEHIITRQLVRFLDVATSRLGRPPGDPRVLLATLPGERHALGLLMVEALLWRSNIATLNLGTDIPMDQIVAAARRTGVSTVALSFSACYPRCPIRAHLEELAHRLPEDTAVWIGGAGVRRLPRLPPSVERKSLDSL